MLEKIEVEWKGFFVEIKKNKQVTSPVNEYTAKVVIGSGPKLCL